MLACESRVDVRAFCDRCGGWDPVNVAWLARRHGPAYSLWNRRLPCQRTAGCTGTVKFHAGLPGTLSRLLVDD